MPSIILGREVRLPTEYEWELAARGTNGRDYAWGDEFKRNKVNCAAFWKQDDNANYTFDLDFAGTSIVGQFKEGNTPEGISDLSGNVYEWTTSWLDEKEIYRVIRGGSWFSFHRDVRYATRGRYVPDDFLIYIGFRLLSSGSDHISDS